MGRNSKTQDRTWLVKVLNDLKNAEYGDDQSYPITIEHIYKYCNPSNLKVRRYRTFYIPKKNGKKREISAPYRTLNNILHFLNILLSKMYVPNASAMGFIQNRSIVDNARIHVGHNYVFNMDLEDFFPSISEARFVLISWIFASTRSKFLFTTSSGTWSGIEAAGAPVRLE